MPNNLIEPEFADDYEGWKKDPSQARSAALLKSLHPTIENAVKTHVGDVNPLVLSQARLLALKSLGTYDPSRGRLTNHIYNQLQGIKRVSRKQSTILTVPERISLERSQVENATHELASELGREPTDAEISDHTGLAFSRLRKIRTYRPAVAEGTTENPETGESFSGTAVSPDRAVKSIKAQLVYDDLDHYHKRVMEHSLGMNGKARLANHQIAAKMKRSPGAISQAKLRIQNKLDEMDELNPF